MKMSLVYRSVTDTVYRIRYGEPVQVESDRNSLVNGKLIPENILAFSEQLYGPPPWKLPFYNQVIVNIFEKKRSTMPVNTVLFEHMLFCRTGQSNCFTGGQSLCHVRFLHQFLLLKSDTDASTMTVD